ncbi:hypothetical protein DVK44_34055 [Streptomyces paludis]|uniref:Acetyl-coenzyme A carboxylase carboxyl transferase subunit beta domain-containing protein n=1 Tax=Streptomyces paludis TaxID=2282738 RepID=A0A345HYZ9_9ACTN|nr:hypothetical protein DVK44_34055 [Streptomyces paludis]
MQVDRGTAVAQGRGGGLTGPRATESQRAKFRLTVRDRLDQLFDKGAFHEIEQLRRHRATGFGREDHRPYTDGAVAGWGLVEGRTMFACARDFRRSRPSDSPFPYPRLRRNSA